MTDIDECALGLHHCDENANCTNTEGSFECLCKPTFFEVRDGGKIKCERMFIIIIAVVDVFS